MKKLLCFPDICQLSVNATIIAFCSKPTFFSYPEKCSQNFIAVHMRTGFKKHEKEIALHVFLPSAIYELSVVYRRWFYLKGYNVS